MNSGQDFAVGCGQRWLVGPLEEEESSSMVDEVQQRRRLLRLVMLGVLIWGGLLALGASLYGFDPVAGDVQYSPNIVRGLIVAACVLGFLGVWSLALWRRG